MFITDILLYLAIVIVRVGWSLRRMVYRAPLCTVPLRFVGGVIRNLLGIGAIAVAGCTSPTGLGDEEPLDLWWWSDFESGRIGPQAERQDGWWTSPFYPDDQAVVQSAVVRSGRYAVRLLINRDRPYLQTKDQIDKPRVDLVKGRDADGEPYLITEGEELWYGFSIYVPPEFIFDYKANSEQVHELQSTTGDERDHPVTVRIVEDQYVISVGGVLPGARTWYYPVHRGAWSDFVFHLRLCRASTTSCEGMVEVWINGARLGKHTGPNSTAYSYHFDIALYKGSWKYTIQGDPNPSRQESGDRYIYVDEVRMAMPGRGSYEQVAPR